MTALIIGTGPSLTVEDCERAAIGRTVYAVNDAYRYYRNPEYLYACDLQWWEWHFKNGDIPQSDYWTCNEEAAEKFNLNFIKGEHHSSAGKYFDASGESIVYGGNGGFQALNLAYVHGHREAVLLGYDMGRTPGKPSHCFGEHPTEIANNSPYHNWLDHWRHAAPEIEAAGMRVYNATRGGRLEVFERVGVGDL